MRKLNFINNTNIRNEWRCELISYILCFDIISLGINSFVNKFVLVGTIWDSLILYVFLLFLILRTIVVSRFKIGKKSFIVFIVILILLCYGLVINIDNIIYIKTDDYINIICGLFLFVLISRKIDYNVLYKKMSKIYWVGIFFGVLHLLCARYGVWMSDMTAGYSLLPSVLFAIDYSNKRKKTIIWVALGIITLSLYGSRGPIFLSFLFWGINIIINSISIRKKIIIVLMFITIIIIYYSNIYTIWLLNLDQFLKDNNMIIASLQKILYYKDFSNGRYLIFKKTLSAINSHPFIGNGIFFDRSFTTYPHNIILEILLDYGYLVGGIIIFLIFIMIVLKIIIVKKYMKNKKELFFILMFSFISIGKLFLSSSYIVDPYFYFALGMFCSCCNIKEKKRG